MRIAARAGSLWVGVRRLGRAQLPPVTSSSKASQCPRGERADQRPIRLVVRDDLARSRLTVFFRLFLAIPLLVWVTLYGIGAFFVAFANWLAVLIQGEVPRACTRSSRRTSDTRRR